jgi:hypothetical protein
VVGLDVLAQHGNPLLEVVDAVLGLEDDAVDGDHAVRRKAGDEAHGDLLVRCGLFQLISILTGSIFKTY